MSRHAPFLLVMAVLSGPASAAEPPDPVRLRDELRAMEALLDATVEQVSRPNPGFFLAGAPSCRGYLLKGYGFVFVLPARWLPVRASVVRARRGRQAQASPADGVDRVVVVTGNRRDPGLRELEAQVEAFQREAERQRADAERAFDEMTRELRARLTEAEAAPFAGAPGRAIPAVAPDAPPAVPPAPKVPPEPNPAPLPPPSGPLSPGAPWVFWSDTESDEQEVKAPERLVADVRDAVVLALEAHGPGLTSLRPDETISVVVDFVAGAPFLDDEARPARSLTLRVRKRDLDDRRAGRLSPEELRRRVEAAEY